VVEDTGAKTPGVYYGWVVPAGRTTSHYALELFRLALAQGESSRLHQLLVRDKAMAQNVSAELTHHRGPSLFAIRIVVARSSSIDKAQKELDGQLRALRVAGLTQAELDKAKARVRSRFLLGLQSNVRRALALGAYEAVWGDARFINDEVEKYEAVTLADIRRAVGEHLLETRRSIVEVYPPGWAKDYYPDILRRAHIVKKGENLIRIAKQYGIPPGDLARHNKLQLNRPIFPGQKLTIPPGARRAPVSSPAGRPPQTVPASSARPGSAPLASGKKAGKGPANGPTSSTNAPVIRTKTHVVKNGETLGRIAKRYGVQVSDIVAHNTIAKDKRIYIGQRLVIPLPARQK
jgi:LysM repeat protein